VKFSIFKNIKSIIYLNSIIGISYVVLLIVVLSIFIKSNINYNSYEKKINTQIFELLKLKELNKKMLNNKFENEFYINKKNKIYDSLNYSIKKSLLNIKTIKNNNLTSTLYLNKNIDLLLLDFEHLQKQYDLYFKYVLQLGNSKNGLYANLLYASNEFYDKLNDLENNTEIILNHEQMKNMMVLFQSSNTQNTLNLFIKKIKKIELLLNNKKSDSNNYRYLRVYDSFKEYHNAFNFYAKKKMQIGVNNNVGVIKKINTNYIIIENRLNELAETAYKKKGKNIVTFIFVLVFLSIIFLLIAYISNRNFFIKQTFFISYLKLLIKDFDKGHLKKKKIIKLPDELYEIIEELNKFSNKLQKTESTLLALPDRQINFDITDPERIQFLDKALLKIWKNFELNDNNLESEKEKRIVSEWIKTGLEKFTSILRKDFTSVNVISKEILNNIIEHLNIAVGAVYLSQNKNETKLNMVANFAFGKESHIQKGIDKGEGIIGTAAIEKKTLNITNIPPNYYKISSGFGASMPKNLLIVPIKFENDFFGIIELASFRLIKAYELEFVEELGKAFAATLSANEVHENVSNDYKNLIEKHKDLENEKNKLEQKIKEFNIDYNKLINSNLEYEVINKNLYKTTIIFDLNTEGYVISANNQFYQTFNIPSENTTAINYLDLIYKSEKKDNIDIDKFWNDIKLGNTKRIVHKIKIIDDEFWLSESYIPIKNNKGTVNKIKVVSINITDYKELEKIIEAANQNIQELRLNNENNDAFIKKIKSELKEAKKETEEVKKRESELIEIIEQLKKD